MITFFSVLVVLGLVGFFILWRVFKAMQEMNGDGGK